MFWLYVEIPIFIGRNTYFFNKSSIQQSKRTLNPLKYLNGSKKNEQSELIHLIVEKNFTYSHLCKKKPRAKRIQFVLICV